MDKVLIRNPDSLLGQKLKSYFLEQRWEVVPISSVDPKPYDLIIYNDETNYKNVRDFDLNYHTYVAPKAIPILLSTSRIYEPIPEARYFEGEYRFQARFGADLTSDEFNPIDYEKEDKYYENRKIDKYFLNFRNRYILRLGCIVGFSPWKAKGFLPKIFLCDRNNEPFYYYGYNGKQIRDQMMWQDLADAIVRCYMYAKSHTNGEVFNIGGGMKNSLSIKEALCNLQFKRDTIYVDKKLDDISIYISNIDKAKKLLNWEPKYNLNDIYFLLRGLTY